MPATLQSFKDDGVTMAYQKHADNMSIHIDALPLGLAMTEFPSPDSCLEPMISTIVEEKDGLVHIGDYRGENSSGVA